jgi:hypothetical protein
MDLAKYKHFRATTMPLTELVGAPKERKLSARQLASLERDKEIKSALNEAAALPASEVYVLNLSDGESLPNFRNAFVRIWRTEPRDLNVAGRDKNKVIISKGKLPGKTWKLSGTA